MSWLIWVVVFYVPVIVGSIGYMLWMGGTYGMVMHTVGEQPLQSAALGAGCGLLVVGLTRVLVPRVSSLGRLADALKELMGPMPAQAVVLVASLSAVGEELLFRGVIQEQLGAVLGVILFAAAHLPVDRDLWLWPVFALVAGAMFAGLYDATGSVLAPATAHFVINGVNLHWLGQRQARSS